MGEKRERKKRKKKKERKEKGVAARRLNLFFHSHFSLFSRESFVRCEKKKGEKGEKEKSPQGIRDLRHRVLVFLSAMFWQPVPACDFSRQKAVVFPSEGWRYLHVFSTVKSPQGIRDLRQRVLVFLSAMFWHPIPACDFSRQKAVV